MFRATYLVGPGPGSTPQIPGSNLFLALALVAVGLMAGQAPGQPMGGPGAAPTKAALGRHYRYAVIQVIDGDTITIRAGGRAVLMQLLGVGANRPEAKAFLKSLLDG